MADDPLNTLATGVAADFQEKKRRGRAKAAGDQAAETAEDAGSPSDEAEALDTVVEDAVDEALEDQDDDQPDAADRYVERLTNIALEARFERGTMVGDLRDTFLDLWKANPRPWSTIPEDEQRRIAKGLETAARTVIQSLVLIIAEDAGEGVTAKLVGYAEKDGLKISLTADGDDKTIVALHHAVGKMVVLRRADANAYDGERREPDIQPDQGDMQFESDANAPANPAAEPPEGDEDLAGIDDDGDAVPAIDDGDQRTHDDTSAVND